MNATEDNFVPRGPLVRRLRPLALRAAGFAALLLLLLAATLASPSWYEPPRIAETERQAVRNNLVSAQQAFTDGLLTRGQPFIYHIYQEDVNRWLAMRREIFPPLEEYLPTQLDEPFVRFDTGRIRIGAAWRGLGPGVVVSVDFSANYEDDGLTIRAERVRCGRIPTPISWIQKLLSEPLRLPRDAAWPGSPRIEGDLIKGVRIGAEAWWKNGGVNYRVTGLAILPGQLDLTIEPGGRHASTRRSDQE